MKDYKYALEIMNQELNNNYISPEIKYAFEASIEILEKQIPKPLLNNGHSVYFCPDCKRSVWQNKDESKYCFRCGQRLNWS